MNSDLMSKYKIRASTIMNKMNWTYDNQYAANAQSTNTNYGGFASRLIDHAMHTI